MLLAGVTKELISNGNDDGLVNLLISLDFSLAGRLSRLVLILLVSWMLAYAVCLLVGEGVKGN